MREQIYFAKMKPEAIIPSKTDENAGYDIYPCFEEDFIVLKPHTVTLVPTGIASACSDDYYFQLFERGSTGTKNMTQHCGVIDSGYRNEWFVPIGNDNEYPIVIHKDDKIPHMYKIDTVFYPYEKAICQAVLLPVPKTYVNEITYNELLEMKSERMLGCLGSSNK